MDGLNHLLKAAQTLGSDGAPFLERFRAAVDEFWAAAFDLEDSSPDLLDRVEQVIDQVLALQLARTSPVEIDEDAAREVAAAIVRLANDVSGGTNYTLRTDEPRDGLRPGLSIPANPLNRSPDTPLA